MDTNQNEKSETIRIGDSENFQIWQRNAEQDAADDMRRHYEAAMNQMAKWIREALKVQEAKA